ncbi:hypothetical protein N7454_010575 [Penicillium verhagenii]|nr:hypothetical protein N7454_010575 [Penicillium verhagenii]
MPSPDSDRKELKLSKGHQSNSLARQSSQRHPLVSVQDLNVLEQSRNSGIVILERLSLAIIDEPAMVRIDNTLSTA